MVHFFLLVVNNVVVLLARNVFFTYSAELVSIVGQKYLSLNIRATIVLAPEWYPQISRCTHVLCIHLVPR